MTLDGHRGTDKLIHNEKKEPKKRNTKEHMTNGQMDKWTNEGSTNGTEVNRTYDTIDKRGSQDIIPLNVRSRKHVEIDEYLFNLVEEGLVDYQYKAWHCKCIYTLGLERYNSIVLDIREAIVRGKEGSGKVVATPKALFGYQLKGHMQLHAKRKFMRED
jgi:hypothetical protein